VHCFYDADEQVDLWGRHLAEELPAVYAGQAAVVAGCAVADRAGVIDPPTALVLAMALTVALTAPIGALAAVRRAGPFAAGAATLTAVGVAAGVLFVKSPPTSAEDLLVAALGPAAASFVVGSIVSLVAPRRGPAPTPGPFDPFAGPSG